MAINRVQTTGYSQEQEEQIIICQKTSKSVRTVLGKKEAKWQKSRIVQMLMALYVMERFNEQGKSAVSKNTHVI